MRPRPPLGTPYTCETPGCGTQFFTSKKVEGYARGYSGRCLRCHERIREGLEPGPWTRQPNGKARQQLFVLIRPELMDLVTNEAFEYHGVENASQLASLALATLLKREDLA